MNSTSTWILVLAMICIATSHSVSADELTTMIEEDLAALGYDVGKVDGEADVSTAIAISKYQAEKDMDVTGEVSPQLAGILAADVKKQETAPASNTAAPELTTGSQASAAQQACLQQKIAAAQEQQPQKKNGLGGMFSSLSKAAAKYGNNDIAKVSADVYEASATMNDLAEAARELGISESEISECEGTTPAAGTATVASASSAATAQSGSAGDSVQYMNSRYFMTAADNISKADGSITQCNRGRPDYRQRFAAMVMEAHPSQAADLLSLYDKNFAAFELKPEYTCSDEQLAEMKRVAGESAKKAFDMLVIK